MSQKTWRHTVREANSLAARARPGYAPLRSISHRPLEQKSPLIYALLFGADEEELEAVRRDSPWPEHRVLEHLEDAEAVE